MKYTTLLLVLGLAAASKVTQKNQKHVQNDGDDEDDDDESLVQLGWTEPWGPGEDGIIDALTPPLEQCKERLWEDPRELSWQMDMFSRTCDRKYYDNSWEIAQKINADLPRVNAWELMDKAFEFSRIRRYDFVNDNMDMLEHFQDNLNMNRSNLVNVENFIRVCKTVNGNFVAKFHDGEFDDPASHDPRKEALEKYNEKIKA
jgi:hypothetical protein